MNRKFPTKNIIKYFTLILFIILLLLFIRLFTPWLLYSSIWSILTHNNLIWFFNKDLWKLLKDTLPYKSEILDILWKNSRKKYLITLMNTSEKKPDWWFFGSYAILDLRQTWHKLEFFDSYYPRQVKKIAIQMPKRVYPITEGTLFEFLWINKIWFTDIDWANLSEIYEKTFDEKLDWVIFVKYDVLKYLIDDYREKSYKREFVNAAGNLIWNTGDNQKKIFLKNISDITSWFGLFKLMNKVFWNLDKIIKSWYIRVYLAWNSENFHAFLTENNLNLEYNSWNLYNFDYNFGLNKADKFVQKKITLIKNWKIILQTENDYFHILNFGTWEYEIQIEYNSEIPASYLDYIKNLELKYNINLGDREKKILSVIPYRHNQWIVYLPFNSKNISATGDFYNTVSFTTPFADGVIYRSKEDSDRFVKKIEVLYEIY
jgi:hypothetical protein